MKMYFPIGGAVWRHTQSRLKVSPFVFRRESSSSSGLQEFRQKQLSSPAEAISKLEKTNRIYVHGFGSTPHDLTHALSNQHERLQGLEITQVAIMGKSGFERPEVRQSFKLVNAFFLTALRPFFDYDHCDYLPSFVSTMAPAILRRGPMNWALIQVSPPDSYGLCSLGINVDWTRTIVENSERIIAQVNPNVPRVHGEDAFLHVSNIDHWIESNHPLPELPQGVPNAAEMQIGKLIAENLVPDGACLQIGIGALPSAVASRLVDHRHLGCHIEMLSDSLLDLIEAGVVDNSRKELHRGVTVSTFMCGSRRLYDAVHDNPNFVQYRAEYVNSPAVIARNANVVAVNSAVEVDLSGQFCADSVGTRIISGAGGQVDFMYGAFLSPNGRPIIAMTSRTASGSARIVNFLKHGAGVVTTRMHAGYIVTEYGIVELFGKTLGERAKALISIAHPDDREHLERDFLHSRKHQSS